MVFLRPQKSHRTMWIRVPEGSFLVFLRPQKSRRTMWIRVPEGVIFGVSAQFLRAQKSHRTTWIGVRSGRFWGFSAPKNRTVPRGFVSGVIVFWGAFCAPKNRTVPRAGHGDSRPSRLMPFFPFLVPQKSLRPTGIHSGPGGKRPPPASSAATLGSARTGPRLALFLTYRHRAGALNFAKVPLRDVP